MLARRYITVDCTFASAGCELERFAIDIGQANLQARKPIKFQLLQNYSALALLGVLDMASAIGEAAHVLEPRVARLVQNLPVAQTLCRLILWVRARVASTWCLEFTCTVQVWTRAMAVVTPVRRNRVSDHVDDLVHEEDCPLPAVLRCGDGVFFLSSDHLVAQQRVATVFFAADGGKPLVADVQYIPQTNEGFNDTTHVPRLSSSPLS